MRIIIYLLVLLPAWVSAQASFNYYEGTAGLSGYHLKTKLHEIISAKTITWNYADLPEFYGRTDLDHFYDFDAGNTLFLLDIYSNNPTGSTAYHYTKDNLISSAGVEGLGYNREHLMPQSSFNSSYPMYSDLFFVIPTDAKINQLRSNYPYGIGGSVTYHTITNGSRISNNASPNSPYTGRVYEPVPEFRGDIARSLLYYAVRYEGKLSTFNHLYSSTSGDRNPMDGTEEKAFEDWYLQLLLQWHKEDPVSEREINRNNLVYQIQKNRNPFIDHPAWAVEIWAQRPGTVTADPVSNLTAAQVSAYFAKLEWQASADAEILGYRVYQNGNYIGSSKNSFYIADHLEPDTNYQFSVKAYYTDYSESAVGELMQIKTLLQDEFSKDLMITKYLEGTDQNKALEITNKTGHAVDLTKYRLRVQYYNTTTETYYYAQEYELEGMLKSNKSVVIMNPRANFDCITNDDAALLSAAPQLSYTGNNYLELRYLKTTVDALGSKFTDNYSALGDVSLYRLPSITDPKSTFAVEEWKTYPADYCENLGTLAASEIPVKKQPQYRLALNPVFDNVLRIVGADLQIVKTAFIYDSSGRVLIKIEKPFAKNNELAVNQLPAGIYFLQLDQQTLKFIKK